MSQERELTHVWPLELLEEGIQNLEGLDDNDIVRVNWGELRKLIGYNQIISRAFMETIDIFNKTMEDLNRDD